MAELVFFRAQVGSGMFAGARTAGNALDDSNTRAFKLRDLVWIIGEQAHGANAEGLQRFGGKFVVARVIGKSEPAIGFDSVQAAVLQFVSFQFIDQADAAAFLRQVEQHAGRLLGNFAQRKFQLRAAIAAFGGEDVAGEALRVDAHQRHAVSMRFRCRSRRFSDCRAGSLLLLLRTYVLQYRKSGRSRSRWATWQRRRRALCPTLRIVFCVAWETSIIAGFAESALEREVAEADTE